MSADSADVGRPPLALLWASENAAAKARMQRDRDRYAAEQVSTPPEDYKPAPWVAQFSKLELQWLAEQLQERQGKARNRALLAESRLAVLEAQNTDKETH